MSTPYIPPSLNSDMGNLATTLRWLYEALLQGMPIEFVEAFTATLTVTTTTLAVLLLLLATHTLAKYLWLTWYFHHTHKSYHSPYKGVPSWRMLWALSRSAVAYNGTTVWLREEGKYQDTHLLHIKRPRTWKGHLWPTIRVTAYIPLKRKYRK